MGYPVWLTKAGDLGKISALEYFDLALEAYDPDDNGTIAYSLISGSLPKGLRLEPTGYVSGNPELVYVLEGVPFATNVDVNSQFTVRAKNTYDNKITDRTFLITVTGNFSPQITSTADPLGTFLDGTEVTLQLEAIDLNSDPLTWTLTSGELPPGLTLDSNGLISGVIIPEVYSFSSEQVGWGSSKWNTISWEFTTRSNNASYNFTASVTDGKATVSRTYRMLVYAFNDIRADSTSITADSTRLTADIIPNRPPVLLTKSLGVSSTVNSGGYYSFKFDAVDLDIESVTYKLDLTGTHSIPPGLSLDPITGWLTGYIPTQVDTIKDYTFGVYAESSGTNSPVNATTTFDAGLTTWDVYESQQVNKNLATPANAGSTTLFFDDVTDLRVGMVLGNYNILPGTYITAIDIDNNAITINQATTGYISDSDLPVLDSNSNLLFTLSSNIVFDLVTGRFNPAHTTFFDIKKNSSAIREFTLSVLGNLDLAVTWNTLSDLGSVYVGSTSNLAVTAVAASGRELTYSLVNGSRLPQGLKLLEDGTISGRISFQAMGFDKGTTTFDKDLAAKFVYANNTSFDSTYTFTVLAKDFDDPPKVSSQKTFTVKVVPSTYEPYENLYIRCLPNVDKRNVLQQIINNTDIFDPADIYRPKDPYFGTQPNIKFLVSYGIKASKMSEYIAAMQTRHFPKKFYFGDYKVAQGKDAAGNVLYDVVYVDLIEDTKIYETVNGIATTKIPAAFTNMNTTKAKWRNPRAAGLSQNQLYSSETRATSDATFIRDNDSWYAFEPLNVIAPNDLNLMQKDISTNLQNSYLNSLPEWMVSVQSDGKILGYTTGAVLAYLKPGAGTKALYNIKRYTPFDIKVVPFVADRYVLNNSYTQNFNIETREFAAKSYTTFDLTTGITVVGSILGNTLTTTSGSPSIGQLLTGGGVLLGTYITAGYGNTWTVSTAQTLSSTTFTAYHEATFDKSSTKFLNNIDTYTIPLQGDKYLKFPKTGVFTNGQ